MRAGFESVERLLFSDLEYDDEDVDDFLVSFDDDETDHFIAASDASQDGLIRRVYRDSYGTYRVEYASE